MTTHLPHVLGECTTSPAHHIRYSFASIPSAFVRSLISFHFLCRSSCMVWNTIFLFCFELNCIFCCCSHHHLFIVDDWKIVICISLRIVVVAICFDFIRTKSSLITHFSELRAGTVAAKKTKCTRCVYQSRDRLEATPDIKWIDIFVFGRHHHRFFFSAPEIPSL